MERMRMWERGWDGEELSCLAVRAHVEYSCIVHCGECLSANIQLREEIGRIFCSQAVDHYTNPLLPDKVHNTHLRECAVCRDRM